MTLVEAAVRVDLELGPIYLSQLIQHTLLRLDLVVLDL